MFGRRRKLPPAESNVPLQICLYLTSYVNCAWSFVSLLCTGLRSFVVDLLQHDLLELAVACDVGDAIFALQGTMSNLDRIRSTPLPFAYQAHLRMSLWLYLIFLPFEVYASLGWVVIPGTVFASFLMLGFLEMLGLSYL